VGINAHRIAVKWYTTFFLSAQPAIWLHLT